MKLIYILPAAMLVSATVLTSCVKDLEVDNINPQEVSDFNEDYIFNKIYGNLVLTGQTGPNGDSDLDDIDEGTSNMTRLIWNLNTLTTDEGHCWWNDPGMPELNRNTWTNSNVMIKALYYRLMFGVTLCNFYLENASGSDAATKQNYEIVLKQMQSAWLTFFLNYDPVPDIRACRCPILAMNGSLDSQVISSLNLPLIKANLSENPQNEVVEFEGLNHLFQHCATGAATEYYNIEETFATEALDAIVKFINKINK